MQVSSDIVPDIEGNPDDSMNERALREGSVCPKWKQMTLLVPLKSGPNSAL